MKASVFYENLHECMVKTGTKTEDMLRILRDEGMKTLYISADSWKRDRSALSRSLERLNLKIGGMHGSCDFPGDPGTERERELVDLALESGAENLLVVPGMLSTGNTLRDLERMVAGMRRMAERGRSMGLPVLMEDYDGLLAPYNCIAGLKYFLDSVEGLDCAFDTGNFVIFHEDELAAFDLFAKRIRTVHLKDRSLTPRFPGDAALLCANGERVYSCAVGRGYIHMAEILDRLKAMAYQGNVIVELYGCDGEHFMQNALDSLRWLRERITRPTPAAIC